MWTSHLLQNHYNTSTSGTVHTEHPLNARRRPQTSKRARKPPKNQVGQKENRNWDRTCAPERKLWRRKLCGLSTPWEAPSRAGRLTWVEEWAGLQRLGKKYGSGFAGVKTGKVSTVALPSPGWRSWTVVTEDVLRNILGGPTRKAGCHYWGAAQGEGQHHHKSLSPCEHFWVKTIPFTGLPWWLRNKESAYQFRRCGFYPWVGKIPWRRI